MHDAQKLTGGIQSTATDQHRSKNCEKNLLKMTNAGLSVIINVAVITPCYPR